MNANQNKLCATGNNSRETQTRTRGTKKQTGKQMICNQTSMPCATKHCIPVWLCGRGNKMHERENTCRVASKTNCCLNECNTETNTYVVQRTAASNRWNCRGKNKRNRGKQHATEKKQTRPRIKTNVGGQNTPHLFGSTILQHSVAILQHCHVCLRYCQAQ